MYFLSILKANKQKLHMGAQFRAGSEYGAVMLEALATDTDTYSPASNTTLELPFAFLEKQTGCCSGKVSEDGKVACGWKMPALPMNPNWDTDCISESNLVWP